MSTDRDTTFHDDLITRLVEKDRTRIYGKYRGVVTQLGSNDEGVPGCLKARVPSVLGNTVETAWAVPCVPFAGDKHGFYFMPEVDDTVWIEFEGGFLAKPIWSGFVWTASQTLPEGAAETTRVISTTAGHRIVLDEGGDELVLEHPGGAKITLASSGITLAMGSCKLEITSSAINLNNGIVKATTGGVGLANDALHVGA